jgi:transcriptional regulator with PAS, ATPase and Fis domain
VAEGESKTRTNASSAIEDSSPSGCLLLVTGEGLLNTFPLVRDAVIGRGSDCDVVVAHATLSRRHARLRLGPPLAVEDLGSKNGTRVAQRLLREGETAPVAVGESFHIGRFSFVVVQGPRSRSFSTRQDANAALRVVDPTLARATPLVRDVAASGVNALILGETGVGKEVLAETLHQLSGRKGALVRINCAALATTLFESELFGHEKGAFTGAAQTRAGLLEAADGGTVFLDEVGELPEAVQAKLLRAIETKEIVRVGGVRPRSVDVRFIAATNRDLPLEVAKGRFRSDLFYRLDGVTLLIPPLRERRDQIAPLALHFLQAAHQAKGVARPPKLAHDLLSRLEQHAWPGNVREVKAVMERAVLLARSGAIEANHLALTPAEPHRDPDGRPPRDRPAANEAAAASEADERKRIIEALEACAGNQTRAAKHLGISRATLVNKLAVHRIPRPRK